MIDLLGELTQIGVLLWEKAFFLKIVLAYVSFRGLTVYSLGWDLFFRQLLICSALIFPIESSEDLAGFVLLVILFSLFLFTLPIKFPMPVYRVDQASKYLLLGFLLALMLLLELGFSFEGHASSYESICWLLCFFPSLSYGVSLNIRMLSQKINGSLGLLDPIPSLRKIYPAKKLFSLAISSYQALLLLVFIGSLVLEVKMIFMPFVLLFFYVIVNFFLKKISTKLYLYRVKKLLKSSKKLS